MTRQPSAAMEGRLLPILSQVLMKEKIFLILTPRVRILVLWAFMIILYNCSAIF